MQTEGARSGQDDTVPVGSLGDVRRNEGRDEAVARVPSIGRGDVLIDYLGRDRRGEGRRDRIGATAIEGPDGDREECESDRSGGEGFAFASPVCGTITRPDV
jgi:hypothetical protein